MDIRHPETPSCIQDGVHIAAKTNEDVFDQDSQRLLGFVSYGNTTSELLSCFFCGTQFNTGGLLSVHTALHTGEKPLACVICKETVSAESELAHHTCVSSRPQQSRTEDKKPLSCSKCGEAFPEHQDLCLHLKRHLRDDVLRCSICGTVCADRDSLVQHMRSHTRQTQFTCSVCGKDFAWRRHLTKHMEVHRRRKKVFRCRACSAEFCTYYLLSKHKLLHQPLDLTDSRAESLSKERTGTLSGEEVCKVKAFLSAKNDEEMCVFSQIEGNETRWDLVQEGRINVSKRDTKTDIQLGLFGDDLQITSHSEGQKEVKQEDPEASQIKEELQETSVTLSRASPVQQLKTEEDEMKPLDHSCHGDGNTKFEASVSCSDFSDADTDDSDHWKPEQELSLSLNSENLLNRKVFDSSGGKTSECPPPETDDSVDSDFWKDNRKSQSTLNPLKPEAVEAGAKYVTDLKPYSCSECGKAYRYSSYLKIHSRQHTERYLCSVCGHKSTSSSNLKAHLRTHTGEKPFSCEVCGKKYTNKASLQSHMSVHTAERKYSCEVCKKSFAWFTELKYHHCPGESSLRQTHEEDTGINLKRHTLYN